MKLNEHVSRAFHFEENIARLRPNCCHSTFATGTRSCTRRGELMSFGKFRPTDLGRSQHQGKCHRCAENMETANNRVHATRYPGA